MRTLTVAVLVTVVVAWFLPTEAEMQRLDAGSSTAAPDPVPDRQDVAPDVA